MEELKQEAVLNNTAEKIWEILWHTTTYSQWTSAFCEGSHYISDWEIGGKTLFLDPNNNGMLSTIKTLNAPYLVEFEHLGEIKEGKEEVLDLYKDAFERYELETIAPGQTKLTITLSIFPEYREMMDKGFTSGIKIIRELAEKEE